MATGDPVDLNLTMSPSSRKIPALLTKNFAQLCQIKSCGEITWIRVRPIDDDDDENYSASSQLCIRGLVPNLLQSSSADRAIDGKQPPQWFSYCSVFCIQSEPHCCRIPFSILLLVSPLLS